MLITTTHAAVSPGEAPAIFAEAYALRPASIPIAHMRVVESIAPRSIPSERSRHSTPAQAAEAHSLASRPRHTPRKSGFASEARGPRPESVRKEAVTTLIPGRDVTRLRCVGRVHRRDRSNLASQPTACDLDVLQRHRSRSLSAYADVRGFLWTRRRAPRPPQPGLVSGSSAARAPLSGNDLLRSAVRAELQRFQPLPRRPDHPDAMYLDGDMLHVAVLAARSPRHVWDCRVSPGSAAPHRADRLLVLGISFSCGFCS